MTKAYSSAGSRHPAQLIEESAELWDQHTRIFLILQQQHKICHCMNNTETRIILIIKAVLLISRKIIVSDDA